MSADSSFSAAPPAILLSRYQTAASLGGISKTHLARLERRGAIGPKLIKLGERCVYSAHELERWAAAGCPPRVRWAEWPDDSPLRLSGGGAA